MHNSDVLIISQAYTVSPFMNISGLSLITLVRTQESNPFMVNWQVWRESYKNDKHKSMLNKNHNSIIFEVIHYLVFSILLFNIDIMNLLRVTKKLQAPSVFQPF